MSKTIEERLAELEDRVEQLRLADLDNNEDMRRVSERINQVTAEMHKELNRIQEEVTQQIVEHVRSVTVSAYNMVAAQIVENVKPEVVAEALTKNVLVTRPATREELKAGTAVPVRQATPAELRK